MSRRELGDKWIALLPLVYTQLVHCMHVVTMAASCMSITKLFTKLTLTI